MQSSTEYGRSGHEGYPPQGAHVGAAAMGGIQGERVRSDSELAKERLDDLASGYLDDEHRPVGPEIPVTRTGTIQRGAETFQATVLHTTDELGNFQRSITVGRDVNGTRIMTQVFRSGAGAVSSTRMEAGRQTNGLETADSVGRLGVMLGTMQWGAIKVIQPKR